jgi:hypothetical protein
MGIHTTGDGSAAHGPVDGYASQTKLT